MKAISVESVSKRFMLRHDRPRSLADGLRSVLARTRRQEFWALKGVSFDVEQGEAVGIIGHNGAGKSTVLKILTGIMEPTDGEIRTRGRVSALIEVGAGFHPEMTGRENIFLNGTILGMTHAEIAQKLDDIVSFAELEHFIDTPVKRYSSGMFARLGFSVAAHVEPQALLVDEVLAVGDLAFQQKCFRHMQGLVANGCAVILVTHSLYSAKQMCKRLVWIHEGQVRMSGDSDSVALEYQNWANSRSAMGSAVGRGMRWGAGGATIVDVAASTTASVDGNGVNVDVTLQVNVERAIEDPVLWVMIANSEGQKLGGTTTRRQPGFLRRLEVGLCTVRCTIPDAPLLPGAYRVTTGLFDKALVPLDRWGDCASLIVEPAGGGEVLITPDFDGSVMLVSGWSVVAETEPSEATARSES